MQHFSDLGTGQYQSCFLQINFVVGICQSNIPLQTNILLSFDILVSFIHCFNIKDIFKSTWNSSKYRPDWGWKSYWQMEEQRWSWRNCIEYFNQLLCALHTQKLVKTLFCHFQPIFGGFICFSVIFQLKTWTNVWKTVFFIRLPSKFLPVSEPLTRWCASTLGTTL